MSAEDYDDVPGFADFAGGLGYSTSRQSQYKCRYCDAPISFKNRKPFNSDGSAHRCRAESNAKAPADKADLQAVLFATGAMSAIISGQIQAAGVDHIHHMNFYDVADAAWRVAAAMVSRERVYREELADGDQP